MAGWNGSGSFTFPYNWEADAAAGINILATRMDTQFSYVAVQGFGNTLTRDGQGQPSANLPMNGFKHTGASGATTTGQYITHEQIVTGGTLNVEFYTLVVDSTATLNHIAGGDSSLDIVGKAATAGGTGGSVNLAGGSATAGVAGTAAGVSIAGGSAAVLNGNAGGVTITGGSVSGLGNVGNGGSLVFAVGTAGSGGGSNGTIQFTGATTLTGSASVTGAASFGSTASVAGAATVSGAATFGTTVSVTGASTLTGVATFGTDVLVDNGRLFLSGRLIQSSGNAPTAAGASGIVGSVAWDTDYLYVAVNTNTWKRVALSTF